MPLPSDLYPPSPVQVPTDLTRPSKHYRQRVVLVLVSLICFVALYVVMVIGSAWLTRYCFSKAGEANSQPRAAKTTTNRNSRSERNRNGGWIIGGICSGVLCLFLVKGLFKRSSNDKSLRLEITAAKQPVLFEFIKQLCQETRAPFPHRVYVSHEVNAAVFYHSSFLSLFLPTPKNLLIGLGLVNRLNLSEFKAVLAHEFGHFSQNSMKLGRYVYTSNMIIGDIVFGRDWLDDAIAWCRGADYRIAIVAWAFTGILWVVRRGLQEIFRGINFANSALSRQMEFNADLVAVSVCGSDAIVHGLARLDLANEALLSAWNDLKAAADRGLYSKDLFYHQTHAVDYIRKLRNDSTLGTLPAAENGNSPQVFSPEDHSIPLMWASHPTNHDREQNAKRHYLACAIDERPSWLLFTNGGDVREDVTRQLYCDIRKLDHVELTDPEKVQAFIDADHAEITYDSRYRGLYDNRYLTPGNFDELLHAPAPKPEELQAACADLYGESLCSRMDAHAARRKDYETIAARVHAAVPPKTKSFSFRDNDYSHRDAPRLLEMLDQEFKADYEWMGVHDKQSFVTHYAMARELGGDLARELENRYRFHLAVQEIHGVLTGYLRHAEMIVAQVGGERNVSAEQFAALRDALAAAREALREQLARAAALQVPALKNVTPGEPLSQLLFNKEIVKPLGNKSNSLDGKWLGELFGQLNEVIDRANRLHFKSLGGILSLQETLAQQWAAR